MPFVEAKAIARFADGKESPFVTKAAFKRAVAAAENVNEIGTPIFDLVSGPFNRGGRFTIKEWLNLDLSATTTLTIVGPDPYTDRKWYASVKVVNGKLKVS